MNNIDSLYRNRPTPESFVKGYFEYLSGLFVKIDTATVSTFIEILESARKRGNHIFFMGNGGSAATASHFANDIAITTRSRAKPFRAISLCDNVSILTAVGNDYGYEHTFTRQLKNMMRKDDVVVAISASGNSPNVIQAVEHANANGGITVGLVGFDGGRLKGIAHLSVHVSTNTGEYGPVEDIHMILTHIIGTYLFNVCRSENQLSCKEMEDS